MAGRPMRRKLVYLLLLLISLAGCTWTRTDPGLTCVELLGDLDHSQELWITGEGAAYIVDSVQSTLCALDLAPGNWQLQAAARDHSGRVTAVSASAKSRGGRQAMSLVLEETEVQTTEARAENVVHAWPLGGGVELSWTAELPPEEARGSWEIFRRPQDGGLWEKIGETGTAETSFFQAGTGAYGYVYALRYRPKGAQILPGPLQASAGTATGVLEISWDFRHTFPAAGMHSLAAPLGLAGERDQEETYYDLIAHFHSQEAFQEREAILAGLGLKLKRELPLLLAAVVEPGPESPLALEEWSSYQDKNLYLEPNWIVESAAYELAFDTPWYLDWLRLPAAQEITRGSQDIRIAVLDSGLEENRLPATVKVLPGYNFVGKSFDTADDFGHGTNVARTIAEAMPVAALQPVKVLGANGRGSVDHVSDGMLYAAGLHDSVSNPYPCQIMNLSLGQSSGSSLLQKTVQLIARETDVLIIAAAGNTMPRPKSPGLFYPARFPEAIAVGAISPEPEGPVRAPYSHYGANLDVVAPPSFEEGTSFATPLVSGVAGLMLAQGIAPREVRAILAETAMDLGLPGWDEEFGHGLVNAEWAVKEITELTLIISDGRGGTLEAKAPLKADAERFNLPPGEYTVQVWVNVKGGVSPGKGDYHGSAAVAVAENGHVTLRLELRELSEAL